MKIERIDLIHCRVPLVEPFRISSGAVAEKDGIVVRVVTDEGIGYGESSPMAGAFYGVDTPESCWRELCESLAPAMVGASFADGLQAAAHVGTLAGSNFSKTGLETAFWDVEAQRQGKPLYALLGGSKVDVPSGLAVGLYETIDGLLGAIARYRPDGYKRFKIKIERGRDVELVRAVREAFGDIPLYVDANGAYDLSDLETFRRLDEFDLMMFEQPFAGASLQDLATLQSQVRTPVCLDESLESVADTEEAIRLGSFQIGNIKIQRVGGFGNAIRVHDVCQAAGIPVWIGTMPELGIGCVQGLHLATLPNCKFPTDVEASTRWFQDDIIAPFLEVRDGILNLSDKPGLGFAVDEGKLDKYAVARQSFGG
jgi:o-succinylbenzoate synthase